MPSPFTLFPALDLHHGNIVRLQQGRADAATVYADDPASVAVAWQSAGASWLHVVDLDRAFGEKNSHNAIALRAILERVTIPIQFGGGLRDPESIRRAFDLGVRRVVLGTVAMTQPTVVTQAIAEFGTERVAVAIDERNGLVSTHGWQESSGVSAAQFAKSMHELGVTRAIVTDISRDGMLSGLDAAAYATFARETNLSVIASGGVASLDDIRRLLAVCTIGIEGVIVGQALYTGAFRFADAQNVIADHFRAPYCES